MVSQNVLYRRRIQFRDGHTTFEFRRESQRGDIIVGRYNGSSPGKRNSISVPRYISQDDNLANEVMNFLVFLEEQGERVTSIYLCPQPVDGENNPSTGVAFTNFVAVPFTIQKDGGGIKRIAVKEQTKQTPVDEHDFVGSKVE